MDTKPLDFFMLRRPMLSTKVLLDFHQQITENPKSFASEIICLFSQPLLQEAVLSASPGLYEAFIKLKEVANINPQDKVLSALYKYLIRMCTRATPYGLFAGFTTGRFSDYTSICFDTRTPFNRYDRLDMAAAARISTSFNNLGHIYSKACYYPSSTLYKIGSTFRFVERADTQTGIQHLLSSVTVEPLLESVLACCKHGASFDQMAGLLSEQMQAQKAKDYLLVLIHMQLLVSELEINVTGEPYLDRLKHNLKNMKGTLRQIQYLDTLQTVINDMPSPTERHYRLENLLSKHGNAPTDRTLLQTDICFNTIHCTVSEHSRQILCDEFAQISALLRTEGPPKDLDKFKQDFLKKYGYRQIPLLEALDCETGVGYGPLAPGQSDHTELLENLTFPLQQPEVQETVTPLSRLKQQLADRAKPGQPLSVTLSDQDLKGLQAVQQTPAVGYWLGSFITSSQQAMDKGNFQFILQAAGGASGLELMGRFCHADPELSSLVKTVTSAQQADCRQEALAEIAHMPDPRTANILARPHLRDYEIVYMAAGSLPRENQIDASDLFVHINTDKQIELTSKRLNKRVFPCMATAHNFSQSLPVYKFLCEMARQQNPDYDNWHWGALQARTFLPRIEYKHWILSKATWNIDKARFAALFEKTDHFPQAWASVAACYCIPRYFQICQGDQLLLIDSLCPHSLNLFRNMFITEKKVRLVEWLYCPQQGLLPEHVHEMVIPFEAKSTETFRAKRPDLPRQQTLGRTQADFPLGSPWLYLRIYCGTKTAESLLTDHLAGFCEKLTGSGLIEKWFFIRYQDPLPHIRLRFFHSCRPDFWHVILSQLQQLLAPMSESGVISSIQTDNYKRELRRYAGFSYSKVESLFHADSQAVLNILQQLPTAKNPETTRWLTGLYGADRLLDALGLQLPDKITIIDTLYNQFFTEFKGDTDLRVQLNKQYRAHQLLITGFMQNPWSGAAEIFKTRAKYIQTALQGNKIQDPDQCRALAASFVHMFFNRLFVSDHRRQELVMYHYLNKYYKTLINKNKNPSLSK